jgi:SAM-dependent methyltransferase
LLEGRRFRRAVDVGGGYGRLSVVVKEFAERVTLAEPSASQLEVAADYLAQHPGIDRQLTDAASLDFPDASVDLVVMVRVMHHLPDPCAELAEAARVLAPGGLMVLEVANYGHALNWLKHRIRGNPLPRDPVDVRSSPERGGESIPFVNHNPRLVTRQLAAAGLRVERSLSVSNLRSEALKRIAPRAVLTAAERLLQPLLARVEFGPSVFFLVRKV